MKNRKKNLTEWFDYGKEKEEDYKEKENYKEKDKEEEKQMLLLRQLLTFLFS